MSAIVLDTETNTLNGYPIEISYSPCVFNDGVLSVIHDQNFDEYFSCPEPISMGAMAVHHILETDLINKPSYEVFRLPDGVAYIVGHNIDYDIQAIKLCDSSIDAKGICTLALSRMVWPDLETHNLTALYYMISEDKEKARRWLRNAHNAKWDIFFTGELLKVIVEKLAIKDMNSLFIMSEAARIPKKITFGKYKGSSIKDLEPSYVAWLLRQDDLDPYLRKALKG